MANKDALSTSSRPATVTTGLKCWAVVEELVETKAAVVVVVVVVVSGSMGVDTVVFGLVETVVVFTMLGAGAVFV